MSSKPWFAWFPADYRAKTAHLTFEQDGAYRRLLDAYYERRAPLPADPNALYRLVSAQNDKERAAVDVIAAEFFSNGDGKLRHLRCDEQIAKEEALHQAWSEAGRKGGLSQAQGRLKPGSRVGSTIPSPHSTLDLQSNLNPKGPPDFKELLELPVVGSRKRAQGSRLSETDLPRTWKDWCEAHREDLDAGEVFSRFFDYWVAVPGQKGSKADWFATWRNWCRRESQQTIPQKSAVTIPCKICGRESMDWWLGNRYCQEHIQEARTHAY